MSTISLAEEAIRLGENSQGTTMSRLVCRLGASIPGANPFKSSMHDVIALASAELSQLEGIDSHERSVAASRAETQLTLDARLFGAPLQSVKVNKFDSYGG
ncbi:hypothetical protein [Tardiphaga sp.]|uniref:hypothetical protein n=1 Tax=Tardiphaga sp. TaxID=1926292 RepID=UPI0026385DBD|nr:hypothetical protein [Tardiphaga sp.]